MTKAEKIKVLVDRLKKWSKEYYNDGESSVSDATYDRTEEKLRELDPTNPQLKKVRTKVAKENKKREVEYVVPMPSLDKKRPGTKAVEKFAAKVKAPAYSLSAKLDGMSGQLVYSSKSKTGLPNIYTGGDATTGFDISHIASEIRNLPKLKKDLVVRGELIIPNKKFKKNWADKYKNSRNLAGGVVNKVGSHEALKDLHFVAYTLMEPVVKPSKGFSQLEALGFETAWNKTVSRISDSVLSSTLKAVKAKSEYLLDGIVVYADVAKKTTDSNPSWAFAFKEEGDENLAEAEVDHVEYNPSKLGRLKPRIFFKTPIELAGVSVSWATGHNAKNIFDKKIGPGAIVEVTRSGEVIPYVLGVIKPARKGQMPDDYDWEWNDAGVEAYVVGEASDVVIAKQIHAFLKGGLGTKHIAFKTILKYVQSGMDTIDAFLNATPKQFAKLDGIKGTNANKFYTEIQQGIKNAKLANVAGNVQFFGELFGARKMEKILEVYPKFKDLNGLSRTELIDAIKAVPGFNKQAADFAQGYPKFRKWLRTTPFVFKAEKALKVTGSALKGHVIVFTGFRNADLETTIKANSGTLGGGVNSKTTILLVKDKGSTSEKIKKAKEQGVKIMTADEFVKKFKL